ncbi:Hypothetical predicted protein [Cloeon dipterum]|uniref:Uncharacterized protein n=1 Tax=Cloeon dipterum TaxID=197152 RepID=A0A8S1D758_9INSE|nr:Hypothetical predicted protein [Cloeon dipterum]
MGETLDAEKETAEAVEWLAKRFSDLGVVAPAQLQLILKRQKNVNHLLCPSSHLLKYAGTTKQPREMRLRRLLAYGSELPTYTAGRYDALNGGRFFTVLLEIIQQADADNPPPVEELIEREPVDLGLIQHIFDENGKIPKKARKEHLQMNRQDRDFRDKEKYPLLRILEEYLNPANGWPLRKCAVFALAVCVQYHCHQNQKCGFYRLAEKYLQSEEDFFYFVQMQSSKNFELIVKPECNGIRNGHGNQYEYTDERSISPDIQMNGRSKRNRRGGWGGGMRSLVNRWYKQQDPADLLKSASHLKGRYGWKHSDLFKMAHVPFSAYKEKDTPYEFAIYFIMHGYEKTMATYADKAELVPLMRVLEQHHQQAAQSPKERCDIIKTLRLKADQVRPDWLTKDTWPALVANMSAQEVVQNMPNLWMIDLDDNSGVWQAAAKVLTAADPNDLDPTAVFAAKMNYLLAMQFEGKCCFRNKRGKVKTSVKLKAQPQKKNEDLSSDEESKKRKPDVVIVNALDHLLEKTLKQRVVSSDKRVVVVIHLGKSNDDRCAFTHSMTVMDVAAWMLLNLRRDYSDLIFLVFYHIVMKKIVFPATNSIEQILKLFSAVNLF